MRSVFGRPSPDLITQLFLGTRGEEEVEEEERLRTWTPCTMEIIQNRGDDYIMDKFIYLGGALPTNQFL